MPTDRPQLNPGRDSAPHNIRVDNLKAIKSQECCGKAKWRYYHIAKCSPVLVGAVAERYCRSLNPSLQQPAKGCLWKAAGLALHFDWVASKITDRQGWLKFHIHAPPLQHALPLLRGAAWKWRRCLFSARGRQKKRCKQQSGYASSRSLPTSRMQSNALPVRSITVSFSLPLCIHRRLFPPHLLLITAASSHSLST